VTHHISVRVCPGMCELGRVCGDEEGVAGHGSGLEGRGWCLHVGSFFLFDFAAFLR
jgi:hypothetical protein